MTSDEVLTGTSRVTVFALFGVVFGYATHHLDARRIGEVAVIGPLTSGVDWKHLWQMARDCGRPTAGDAELAQWVLTQATRAFVCGSDRIAQFDANGWRLEPGGMRVRFESTYANRDQLWLGNLTVDGLAEDQVSWRPTIYTA
ncbi:MULTISPECIES: hypothetical protein [Streptomyces]|uniref:Uncharacterized protein n=1 Tax=Streptomyces tsukubensis (strain DSM 42081 / NBRC 108919 / NRRL 18488 / 9993) TaxID=1114943 RepID=I2N2D7_STRT9|nr:MULTISPECIES: hypothetical protein [Streptomyces]AZK95302.1 hypothetical protein B7R87_16650 [Streptomyces tsukubensis]EIF91184.1 hypothetical protein [Streptomyces tsukubensis NRRL18488]MYS62952.1 hypothetical protein [Streptomyces sp. SID5473]QKM68643.1 hypothetical protein STSU_017145 [Streptomyces tsukubensis NRRL18488]TAI43451.1 hypothetical protein EWI31_16905 [Streptomyces tsukubensis]